ncbi:exopolysaccharide production protein [Novosphingobium sp. Rr 2-17]|uniref:O-antigen ligase family protein n=1 Tax=Novosphingobium sp. Rr 2-17 TaxID=555793 RepID=UPI00026991DB|nr:O-antigen ligase family protein [Novosphingobium sp. Rr 2-17]EIZ79303.1 exopolysaccharide production protein [Novosphingobium sp. Rr 2-17]
MEIEVARSDGNRTLTTLSFLSFLLLMVCLLATPFVEMSGALSEEQKVYRLYAYGLVGLLQIALIPLRGWKRSLRIFNTPVILFMLWSALSLAWSQDFQLTGKRLVLLGLVYSGIFSGICDLGTRRSFGIVRTLLVIALILNFIAALAIPSIGTHALDKVHLWRGFMAHKNIAGMLCAVTIILFTFDCSKISTPIRLTVIAGAVIFFYLAWSKTAWITLPVALILGSVIARAAQRAQASPKALHSLVLGSRILVGLLLLGLIVMTLQRDFFLSLTDDTTALTTRAAIWRPMIQFYLDHPWLGSGYGAYWDASANLLGSGTPDISLWKNVDQGHNGYLDLLVQVGLPGLALALYVALVRPPVELTAMFGQQPHRAALISALILFILLENFSESSLLADDVLANAFLLIALASLHSFKLHSDGRRNETSSSQEGAHFASAAELRARRQKLHHNTAGSLVKDG